MKTQDVIKHFENSVPKAAKALGLSTNAIYMWGDEVPKWRQFQVHVVTNGALRVDEKYLSAKAA